jgi:hypothetical protein
MIALFLELQRVAWRVAFRIVILPMTSLISRKERHLAWRLNEVCFGSQRPGLYPEVTLANLVDHRISVIVQELPTQS